jgi:hypothetical protein
VPFQDSEIVKNISRTTLLKRLLRHETLPRTRKENGKGLVPSEGKGIHNRSGTSEHTENLQSPALKTPVVNKTDFVTEDLGIRILTGRPMLGVKTDRHTSLGEKTHLPGENSQSR